MEGGGAGRGRRPSRGRGAGLYGRPPWPVGWQEGGVERWVEEGRTGGEGGGEPEGRGGAKSQVDQVAGARREL